MIKHPRLIIALAVTALALLTVYRSTAKSAPWHDDRVYAASDYYNAAFLAEQAAVPHVMDDHYFEHLGDFHGRYFNVVNGWRVTTGQPAGDVHTVWMFGNSTMAAQQVPDWYTIPSLLQSMLHGYRVENRGLISLNVAGQLVVLRDTPLKPGDIVIFYDGVMDAVSGGLKGGPTFGTELQAAAQYSHQHGAAFYHFLQPVAWSMPLDDYEQRAIDAQMPGQDRTIIAAWPALEVATVSLGGIDLTHVLDGLRKHHIEVYLDGYHVTETANRVIARAMFDALTVY